MDTVEIDKIYDGDDIQLKEKLPNIAPLIHLNNPPVLPSLLAPVVLPKGPLVDAVELALSESGYIALVMTKNTKSKSIKINNLNRIGVLAKIIKKINIKSGKTNVLLQGVKRFKIKQFVKYRPFMLVKLEYLEDDYANDLELKALVRMLRSVIKKLSKTSMFFTEEMRLAMLDAPNASVMADLVMFSIGADAKLAQQYLEINSVATRYKILLEELKKEQEISDIQNKISKEVNEKIAIMQREYFLKEQLKVIKEELGYEQDEKTLDIKKIKKKIKDAKVPKHVAKVVKEELEKLQMIPEMSPEYSVTRNYLDWVASVPWSKQTKDRLNIKTAKKVLDKYHYGLNKVKSRILEYLSVKKLNSDYDSNILLFIGPPGTGKTSLGQAIAKAMGRKFYRFSLGGMRDEAEIKGHRRTYVGAMPGKIMQGLKRVGTSNPVIMLDEVDKLGNSFQGDPASALLEVLDPEQNKTFIDHYLDLEYDLSDVLFICTANDYSTVPAPLLDRMETIEFQGYIAEEKVQIAIDYLIPKLMKKHGLKKKNFNLNKTVLKELVNKYARDPGIRSLEKYISQLMRKTATKILETKQDLIKFNKDNLEDYLGPHVYIDEEYRKKSIAGVATGLAWTSYGGDVLFIESTNIKNKDNSFKTTGQLGDVMKESSYIAYTIARQKLKKLNTKNKFFEENEIHLHLPSGAVPKDGPSAGITMSVSLLGLALNKKIPNNTAMTGELSLVGRVLPVGGIKEKMIAAVRFGIKNIIMPESNKKDLKDLPDNVKNKLNFNFVKDIDEVIDLCFFQKSLKNL